MTDTSNNKKKAIEQLNKKSEKVLISLLRSQTFDLYANKVAEDLIEPLEKLRRKTLDNTKLSVDHSQYLDNGYLVTVDRTAKEELFISDQQTGGYHKTLGGGLCNLSKDLEIILGILDPHQNRCPPLNFLTWSDAAAEIQGETVEGESRTSIIFQDKDFEKLIVCERGPTYDASKIDPWEKEKAFYKNNGNFIFVGQEPYDSEKFDYIRKCKLVNSNLKVFWLVGGNQLKQLYTDYKDFLAVVDVVSFNLAEAAQFFGFEELRPKHKDADELRRMYAREISRRTLRYGASTVVITDGAKGASLARQARGGKVEFVYSPLIQENIVEVEGNVREDTGCGDSFAASVAAYFLTCPDRFKLKEAANFAHYIAGIIYQRASPHLNRDDVKYVELAYHKAQQSSAFVGRHEMFDRNECQIKKAGVMPRGKRTHVLVLLLGGNPADPGQPHITGAYDAVEKLANRCVTNQYQYAPLIRIVPRLTTNLQAQGKTSIKYMSDSEMDELKQSQQLCYVLGDHGNHMKHGVLKESLIGHDGIYILRVTLLEALEIMASENFAELFGDIKFWHFATEKVDERLVWHAKKNGVSKEQSQEIIRQSLRDYITQDLGPQYRFSRAKATNMEEFNLEMTEQLQLRVNALLSGVFNNRFNETPNTILGNI